MVLMQRTTRRYSIFSLLREARRQHAGWAPAWDKAEPQRAYDIVIVGGGAHALATAYYLAKNYGIHDVAVLEKGRIGGTAHGPAIVRSSLLRPQSMALFGVSHRLFESLSRDVRFNTMFSPRGLIEVATCRRHFERLTRIADANRNFGLASWMITAAEARGLLPILSGDIPVLGALWQPRGGIVHTEALCWGFARRASDLGVDVVEECRVGRVIIENDHVAGVETSKGKVAARAVLLTDEDTAAQLAHGVDVALPLQQSTQSGFSTIAHKPMLDVAAIIPGLGSLSQVTTGEVVFQGLPQSGTSSHWQQIEDAAANLLHMFPVLGGSHLLRSDQAHVSLTPDASPLIGRAGPAGLYVNAGWGGWGGEAAPGSGLLAASMLARKPHPAAAPFSPDRFASGHLVDERFARTLAHPHVAHAQEGPAA
jgi:sarcosine oxidase, subunit beta